MDTPESTLLVVLQVVSAMLTMLVFVAALQARHREGLWLWVAAFALHAVSQVLRQLVSATWGHQVGLPIGHLGGTLAYAFLYIGIRRYLGLPLRSGFTYAAFAIAAVLSIIAVSQGTIGMNFASLAMTTCITAMFQSLIAITFWNAWHGERGPARLGAAIVFAISAIASLGRTAALVPAWHMESSLVHANAFWLLAFIALNILQAGSLLFLVNQSLLDELQNMADFDTLTGLLNRGGLSRRMKRERAQSGTRTGLLCIDLDHFKSVNDVHGHGAGDDVLRCFGQLLRDNSRPRDIPARQGGEEFEMVVEAASKEELRALAERLRTAVERDPFPTRVGAVPVTISIGAALAMNARESIDELAERADQSLLAAKRAGRNCVVLASDRPGDRQNQAS